MPLKKSLDKDQSFDPKDVAILLRAYDDIVAELALRTLAEKEEAAKIVLQLALGQTDLDAAKLQAGVIALMMQRDGAANHYSPSERLPSAG
jgi:hypothetical protein